MAPATVVCSSERLELLFGSYLPGGHMYQTILDAMTALSETPSIFGSENPQKGESEFQLALGKKLDQMTEADGWTWRHSGSKNKEERFKTDSLSNEETIAIDLMGRHKAKGVVAIELKYVLAPPKNKYGFPWDVAKDCLKLDLLRGGHCTPQLPNNLQTYVIAMTDWSNFWRGKGSFGWATNFVNVMRETPVRFEGVIKTTGGNPEKTIFKGGRCHIAFALPWTGEWRPYGSTKQAEQFRYLILRPELDAQTQWTHHETLSVDDQSEIYPFLNRDSRDEWRRRYDLMWKLHKEEADAGTKRHE